MLEHKTQYVWVYTLGVFALALCFLLIFGDRDGFEGDDLNSVLPMLHLREALAGQLLIYRPDWQPLSYELGAAVYNLTGRVSAIFVLCSLFVAAGIALQYHTVRALGFPTVLFIPLLFLFPEVLYTGLYYNSSALGFPFVCAAVFFAVRASGRLEGFVIGALLAIAVLMRIDFVLIAPFVVILRVWRQRRIADFILAGLGAIVVFGLALLLQLLDPKGVVEVYTMARQEIVDRANEPGWDNRTKLFVASVIFSPLGWAVLVVGAVWTMLTPRYWVPVLIGLLCLVPMIYAVQNILTPKYMVPAFAVFPIIVAMFWIDVTAGWRLGTRRILSGVWIVATVFFVAAAAEPQKQPPFVNISMAESRVIGTHDGPRSWGAYLWHMSNVKSVWAEGVKVADAISEALANPHSHPIVFVGPQGTFSSGAPAWRHLQIDLVRKGYTGRLLDKGFIAFDIPSGPVAMMSPDVQPPADYDDACFIDLRRSDPEPDISTQILEC